MSGAPSRGVETERHVLQTHLVASLVQREVAVQAIVTLGALSHAQRDGAIGREIRQITSETVKGKAECTHGVGAQLRAHGRRLCARIEPTVRCVEMPHGIALHHETSAAGRTIERETIERSPDGSGGAQRASEQPLRNRPWHIHRQPESRRGQIRDRALDLRLLRGPRRIGTRTTQRLERDPRARTHHRAVRCGRGGAGNEPRKAIERIDDHGIRQRPRVQRVEAKLPGKVDGGARSAQVCALDVGHPIRQTCANERRIDADRVDRRGPECEFQIRVHRRRLEATPASSPTAVQRGHRPIHHHPAQVEPCGVGNHVVAEFLRQEIDGAVQAELSTTGQNEARIHLERVDRAMRVHRPMCHPLERQLRRKLRQLSERDRTRVHVEVERLPPNRVHRCASHRVRYVAPVLMHDVEVGCHQLLRS